MSRHDFTALYVTLTLFCSLCCYGFVLLSSAAGTGEELAKVLFAGGHAWTYRWESAVLLNERDSITAGHGKDVGFAVSSDIVVESIGKADEPRRLLRIRIAAPKLHVKSRKSPQPDGFVGHASALDSATNRPFYIVWNRGAIESFYLATDEPTSLSNVKRGIASLFQFQLESGETTETDASGRCNVAYKTHTDRMEKLKTACDNNDLPHVKHPDELMGTRIDSHRFAKYSFNSHAIERVTSNEKHSMYLTANEDVGNAIETRQTLELLDTKSIDDGNAINVKSTDDVLALINRDKSVYETVSLLTVKEPSTSTAKLTFTGALQENRNNLLNDLLGKLPPATAFLQLIDVARRSSETDIAKALDVKKNQKILPQIYDVLGYVQTLNAHRAAMKKIHLDKHEDDDRNERYLWSLSMCSQPNTAIIDDLLKRFENDRKLSDKLKETLLHTIATMTYRLKKLPKEKRIQKLEDAVEKVLLNGLDSTRASKSSESHLYLRALRNLRSANTIEPLLLTAETGTPKETALAWQAIKSMGKSKWTDRVLKQAHRTFFQIDKKQDSSARTLALDVLMSYGPSDRLIEEFLDFLTSKCRSFEVRQYLLQTLRMTADACETFAERMAAIVAKKVRWRSYDVLAQRGLSTALRRPFLRHKSSNGSLVTVQEMFGGIVKRGVVDVTMSTGNLVESVFSLGIFSGGLSGFVSNEAVAAEETDESATAGMELSVLGTHMRPFVFFNGQGELMGHVWSGTASERTSAYQALVMLQDHLEHLRLGNGFVAQLISKGAASFDLSGKIEFSLWNRNAESLVEKSAALHIIGTTKVDASFVGTQVEYNVTIEPQLHLRTDIDFSSNVNLCMRLTQPDTVYKHNIEKVERIPGTKHRLHKSKYRKLVVHGKTYSLNEKNNEMCNAIFGSS